MVVRAPTVGSVAGVMLIAGVLAGCSPRESKTTVVPTAVPTIAPGGVVPWADLPLPLHPIKAAPRALLPSLTTPSTARAGEDLQYELALENTGTNSYQPKDCPVYVAWLQDASPEPVNIAGEPLTLNCAPAGAIPPGGRARFAMELWLPPTTPPGRWQLAWAFASATGVYGTEARAVVEVLPP